MSRHRGAKPPRRCGLLGEISLLSPEYLLFDERWPFHTETTGSLGPAFASARRVCLAVKHPYALALYSWFPLSLRVPLRASVTFWEATAPVKLPACYGLDAAIHRHRLVCPTDQGGVPLAPLRAPTYALQTSREHNSRV